MRKMVFFLGILIFLFNCTSNVEKPKNLLDEDKMVLILTDLYLYQQAGFLDEINSEKSNFSKIDAQILYNHQTNPKDFKESYQFYYLHPEKFNDLLKEVQEHLEEKLPEKEHQKRIEERKNKEEKK